MKIVILVATLALLLLVGGVIVLTVLLLKAQVYKDGKFVLLFLDALQPAQNMKVCFKQRIIFMWNCAFLSNLPQPVDCGVKPWGAWTFCSATCGRGVKHRNRKEKHCIKVNA